MKPDNVANSVFEQLKASVNEKLVHQGYQPVHEEHSDRLYNSRYMLWSNNNEALRLTWDGKEGLFLLEVTSTLPLNALTQWAEIIEVPFDEQNENTSHKNSVINQVLSSLD